MAAYVEGARSLRELLEHDRNLNHLPVSEYSHGQ